MDLMASGGPNGSTSFTNEGRPPFLRLFCTQIVVACMCQAGPSPSAIKPSQIWSPFKGQGIVWALAVKPNIACFKHIACDRFFNRVTYDGDAGLGKQLIAILPSNVIAKI